MSKPSNLIQGALDLLILKTLSLEPLHGWAIAKRIQQVSGDVLRLPQGSLYPVLHRLEHQGWVRAEWHETGAGRHARHYALTRPGHQQLEGVGTGIGSRRQSGWSRGRWSRRPCAGS